MRIGHSLLIAIALLFNAGCMTLNHTPKDFELEEPWPTLKASGPVAVRSGEAVAGRFEIKLAGATMTVDLQEYTDAVVERVRAALTEQGIAVDDGAPTAVEIEVVYTNILPQMSFHCIVDFTVRADNGYVRGHQARANSRLVNKACNAALSQAAYELLGDEVIQQYLAGGS
jgi:hypothetical protein